MKLSDARDQAIRLIRRDLLAAGRLDVLDHTSPDSDVGKFSLGGQPARLVAYRDGYYLNINLDWFSASTDMALISGGPIFWYVFVIPPPNERYFICDHNRMRRWVLDFAAPKGISHQDHVRWRSDLHPIAGSDAALFRWGDEDQFSLTGRPDRIIDLDNVVAVIEELDLKTSSLARGQESQAHLLLKEYVAAHPELLGIAPEAEARIEYPFATGDRVDVLFENHVPNRSVVEVELEGEQNLVVGIQQALKYQTLAGVEVGYPVVSHQVRAHCVAYETNYPAAMNLARQYGVNLVQVQPEIVLVDS